MAGDVIFLDTHVLLWWALDSDKLSTEAKKSLQSMERNVGFVSAISFWELAIKVKRGKLTLPMTVSEFVRRVKKSGALKCVPVDTEIWLESVALDWDHLDPADRVIVASARLQGLPVLTKDAMIRASRLVRTLW